MPDSDHNTQLKLTCANLNHNTQQQSTESAAHLGGGGGEVDDDDSDVVARAAVDGCAREHGRGDARGGLARGAALARAAQAALGKRARLLVAQHVPQAVARQQQQLVVRAAAQDRDLPTPKVGFRWS